MISNINKTKFIRKGLMRLRITLSIIVGTLLFGIQSGCRFDANHVRPSVKRQQQSRQRLQQIKPNKRSPLSAIDNIGSNDSNSRNWEKPPSGKKKLEGDPWNLLLDTVEVGSKVKGKITNITEDGLFIELEAGINGFISNSEVSCSQYVQPYKIGDAVEAVALSLDQKNRTINLSRKPLMGDSPSADPITNLLSPIKELPNIALVLVQISLNRPVDTISVDSAISSLSSAEQSVPYVIQDASLPVQLSLTIPSSSSSNVNGVSEPLSAENIMSPAQVSTNIPPCPPLPPLSLGLGRANGGISVIQNEMDGVKSKEVEQAKPKDNLLDEIRTGVKLRRVKSDVQSKRSLNNQDAVLDEIKQGPKLRRVKSDEMQSINSVPRRQHPETSLEKEMEKRRKVKVIAEDDEEPQEEDDNQQDWGA